MGGQRGRQGGMEQIPHIANMFYAFSSSSVMGVGEHGFPVVGGLRVGALAESPVSCIRQNEAWLKVKAFGS